MELEEIATNIVDAANKVHRTLGPGLLESAYQECLAYELRQRGLQVECEVSIPVIYENSQIEVGYRADMIVENSIIIENKTVDQLVPIHKAQLLTYMKLGDFHLGFLLSWNSVLMKDGIKRMVNHLPELHSIKKSHKEI